jgi:hypothetical protein
MSRGKEWNSLTEATLFHPCAVAINKNNSSEHKSLFSLSFLGVGTSSIARLSPNGEALTAAHVARMRAVPPETWRPGIAEQYTLQLDKLSAGTASTAIVSMPVYTARPSASNLLYQSFCPPKSRAETEKRIDKPEPGKKYISIVAMLNHPWSRGTIVRPDCFFCLINPTFP